DYYTDASLAVDLRPIEEFAAEPATRARRAHGEVSVRSMATMFKKVRFDTHETVGSGPIHLPEQQLHTTAYWVALDPDVAARLPESFRRPEAMESGLLGLGNVLVTVAPLYLMCEPRDIRLSCQARSPHTGAPTIFLYEAYPAGVGFSEKL